MKWLNYHHLLYFRVIAKEGSISKASEKLLVGQPALSTQLKQLEESLGVLLFERKSRGLELTESGKLALEYADEIFNRGEEFLQVFNSENVRSQKRYRLGAIAGLPKALICQVIRSIKNLESTCFVSTFEAENLELEERILSGNLDLMVTNNPGKPNSEIHRSMVGKSQVSVYGASKFSSLSANFPVSLKGQPLILETMHSKIRYDVEQALADLDVDYKLVAECQDFGVNKALAEAGEGLVFLPEFAGEDLVRRGDLVKVGVLKGVFEEYWFLNSKQSLKKSLTKSLLADFSL